MDDIQFEFAPSKLWWVWLAFFYFAALLYIALQRLPLMLELFLVTTMVVTAAHDLRTLLSQQKFIRVIKCHQENWYVRIEERWHAASISLHFRSPLLVIVCCHDINALKVAYRCIWRDALTAQQWRKLRVYLSVCQ